jgi:hypothetical protein
MLSTASRSENQLTVRDTAASQSTAGSQRFFARFFRPDGREIVGTSAAPPPLPDPVDRLRAEHRAAGIGIDGRTGFPRWDGRLLDYDHAVFCLMAPPAAVAP